MTDAARTRSDLPVIEADSRPFWDGVRERGVFSIVSCNGCGRTHHYPRPFCPHCWSGDVRWNDASGKATLYTYSIVYFNDLPAFADKVPYVAAVVELEEGPRVMTRIVECPLEDLAIGMPLRMVTESLSDSVSILLFTPRIHAQPLRSQPL